MSGSMLKAKISDLLTRPVDDDAVKITVRLDGPEAADLEEIARRLQVTRTAAASILLEAAITDATLFLEDVDREPDLLNAIHDPRTLRSLIEVGRKQGVDLEKFFFPDQDHAGIVVQRAGEIVGESN